MITRRLMLAAPALLAACALRSGPPQPGTVTQARALASGITQLGASVDPTEAQRAATVAYAETHRLALAYQITDSPLIHNAKVNAGTRPRGLCWHWAEDMEARLNAEGFTTLALHRAIANADSRVRIDHSTAIIAPAGAPWRDGMVLAPWRKGGVLFWSPLADDDRYVWVERSVVLKERYSELYAIYGDAIL